MHFGLFSLMTQRDRAKTPGLIYRETLDHVKIAEQIGMEVAWFAEHHFSNYCMCPSPLAMSTYMAGQTSTIKVGPAVIVAPLYEPVRLAEDIGVADQISDGRLVLGFGSGYQEYEFHKFGRDLKQARTDLLEILDFVHAYLNNETFSFNGTRIQMPETSFSIRPVQKHMPVYVAGMGSDVETQRRAVERGYTPFFTTGWSDVASVAKVKEGLASTYASAGGDVSTMPFAIQRYIFVTDSREEALQAADGARYIRRIAAAMRGKYGKFDGAFMQEVPADDEPPLEEILERLPMGDPETVAERLSRDIDALGPDHISCFMGIPGMPQAKVLKSMERFGSEVMPLLEKRYGDLSRLGGMAEQTRPVRSLVNG
ncbi:alkanesulfonate monooxygenase SsuD/methylene tetrahydromethanopterin reductase-like flavin-dependent oxidoreductase (luciferase family) [Rhodoligotrophos appendicifer]|uniref:LLM class flavin-dependent oxidoreductase n=1 Tax=Rhodoligotrophos appendicifer TaxID=987056 RepID=UPI00118147E0|nr:LLM class flavin-dependent oxidoreductase [Rhodoligotrophos appendicifer]